MKRFVIWITKLPRWTVYILLAMEILAILAIWYYVFHWERV